MTYFKIGLLAIIAVVALGAVAFGLGIRVRAEPVVVYHTLVDESVSGLDLGAPVKYRGVEIGHVSAIAIASDRRFVDVSLAVRATQATLLLAVPREGLHAELSSTGITGVKYIDFDFSSDPPPELDIAEPDNYIPARASLITRLTRDTSNLRALVDSATRAIDDVDALASDLRKQNLAARIANAIASADKAFDALGSFGKRTGASAAELQRTVRDIGEAARSFRDFMDELQRQPDMLIKGRGRPKGR